MRFQFPAAACAHEQMRIPNEVSPCPQPLCGKDVIIFPGQMHCMYFSTPPNPFTLLDRRGRNLHKDMRPICGFVILHIECHLRLIQARDLCPGILAQRIHDHLADFFLLGIVERSKAFGDDSICSIAETNLHLCPEWQRIGEGLLAFIESAIIRLDLGSSLGNRSRRRRRRRYSGSWIRNRCWCGRSGNWSRNGRGGFIQNNFFSWLHVQCSPNGFLHILADTALLDAIIKLRCVLPSEEYPTNTNQHNDKQYNLNRNRDFLGSYPKSFNQGIRDCRNKDDTNDQSNHHRTHKSHSSLLLSRIPARRRFASPKARTRANSFAQSSSNSWRDPKSLARYSRRETNDIRPLTSLYLTTLI